MYVLREAENSRCRRAHSMDKKSTTTRDCVRRICLNKAIAIVSALYSGRHQGKTPNPFCVLRDIANVEDVKSTACLSRCPPESCGGLCMQTRPTYISISMKLNSEVPVLDLYTRHRGTFALRAAPRAYDHAPKVWLRYREECQQQSLQLPVHDPAPIAAVQRFGDLPRDGTRQKKQEKGTSSEILRMTRSKQRKRTS